MFFEIGFYITIAGLFYFMVLAIIERDRNFIAAAGFIIALAILHFSISREQELFTLNSASVTFESVMTWVYAFTATIVVLVSVFMLYVSLNIYLFPSDHGYSKSRGGVYYDGERIDNVDVKTFRTIGLSFDAEDREYLYHKGYPLYKKTTDSESFQKTDGRSYWLFSDTTSLYLSFSPGVPGSGIAKRPEFTIVERDNNTPLESVGSTADYVKDSEHVYYAGKLIPGAVSRDFQFVPCTEMMTDKKSVYINGEKIPGMCGQSIRRVIGQQEGESPLHVKSVHFYGDEFVDCQVEGKRTIYFGAYQVPVDNPSDFVAITQDLGHDRRRLYYQSSHVSPVIPDLSDVRLKEGGNYGEAFISVHNKTYRIIPEVPDYEGEEYNSVSNTVDTSKFLKEHLSLEISEVPEQAYMLQLNRAEQEC